MRRLSVLNEKDIYEIFMEFFGIQSIDQAQGEYLGNLQAKEMTRDWLMDRGFEHKAASSMVYKALRSFKEK